MVFEQDRGGRVVPPGAAQDLGRYEHLADVVPQTAESEYQYRVPAPSERLAECHRQQADVDQVQEGVLVAGLHDAAKQPVAEVPLDLAMQPVEDRRGPRQVHRLIGRGLLRGLA